MQEQEYQPRFKLVRRYLFPYSGEEVLTRAQGARIIITWATVFPVALLVCTLPVVALLSNNASLQKIALLLLLIFVAGVVLFGLMAWLVVLTINRSARYFQRRKAQNSARISKPSGGRYGS
jgi:ATP/ADP translocase